MKLFSDGAPRPADSDLAAAILEDVAGDITVRDAVAAQRISTRLRNLIDDHDVGRRALREVLLDRNAVDVSLRTAANVGRKTLTDFWDAVGVGLARCLEAQAYDKAARRRLADALAIDAELLRLDETDAPLLPIQRDHAGRPLSEPPTEQLFVALAERAMEHLSARERDIMHRRFAPLARDRETLEQIGDRLGLTRERVRQLEKRGLAEVKRRLPRDDLRPLLQAWGLAGWDAVSRGADLLKSADLFQVAQRLHGSVLLLIEVANFTTSSWLDAIASPYPRGWLSPRTSRTVVDDLDAGLAGDPRIQHLPRAISDFGPFEAARAALVLIRGLHVEAGYVFSSRPTARPRRAATVHAVFGGKDAPLPLLDLHFAYSRLVPEDPCSVRDLVIVMDEARHLFLETAEGEWLSLGPSGDRPAWPRDLNTGEGEDAPLDDVLANSETELTVAGALQEELRRSGPQAIGQIAADARRILPAGRSANSIGPTLMGRPELFVRLLPGVYGLPSQTPTDEALLRDPLPFLFNEGQARLFVYGRRAGESWGAFPLWRPETEMRLCEWARRVGAEELYRSLLAAAEIDAWPANAEYRAEWRELKRRHGRYDLLSTIKDERIYERPALDRILAALADVEARGRTSWVRLNRVLGRRIDTQVACGLLAALIALGAADPPAGEDPCPWQLPHHFGAKATPWRAKLASEWRAQGELTWSASVGRELAKALCDGRHRLPSWIEPAPFVAAYAQADEVAPRTVAAVGSELVANRRMMEFLDWLDAS